MSSPDQQADSASSRRVGPEAAPLELPSVTINPWQEGDGDASSEPQSVFSARSGILDPLKRADLLSQPEEERPVSTSTDPAKTVDGAAEPRHKVKVRPKLAKSKRQMDRARRRQMNYLQKRREKKKMRVFYQRIRLVFKLCFAILWAVLLWEVFHSDWWLFRQPDFALQNAQLLEAAQMKPLVSAWQGKPLYALDTGKLGRKLEAQFGIVDRAVVRRALFPARLTVQVLEKQPWGLLYADEQAAEPYALLVPDGIVSLAPYHYRAGLYGGRPLEKVQIAPHTVWRLRDLARLREIAWQARQIPGLHLQSVDARQPAGIVLHYQELPVMLGTLNATAGERLARLLPVLPKIREFQDDLESVDLRWEGQVTFHQKPDARMAFPSASAKTQG